MRNPMKITLLTRRPLPGQHSVERINSVLAGPLAEMAETSLQKLPFHSRRIIPRVRNVLHCLRLKGDVVHIVGDVTYCALGVVGRKCVITLLDLGGMQTGSKWKRGAIRMLWYYLPARRADHIIFISGACRDEFTRLFPWAEVKSSVIGCPVTINEEILPDRCSGVQGTPLLLFVGTKVNKNTRRMVDALYGMNVRLRVIGKLSSDLRGALDSSGHQYTNAEGLPDDAMYAEYREADLLCFASTSEGFGMPIIEAQIVGTPVLTSAVLPMSEVAGRGAVLVDPLSVEEIRRAVVGLLTDEELRKDVVRLGRENALRFSADSIASEYIEMYRKVMSLT